MPEPNRKRSSIRFEGIPVVLEQCRKSIVEWSTERFYDHRLRLRYHLPDEEIHANAEIAGSVARAAIADGIQEAYVLGSRGEVRGPAEWPAEHVRAAVIDEFTKRMRERRSRDLNNLSDEVISRLARTVAILAKTVSEEPIAEAHRMGVNRDATREDHERSTTPVPGPDDDGTS